MAESPRDTTAAPATPARTGGRLKPLLGAAIALALLAVLLRQLDLPTLAATAARVPAWVWLTTLAGALGSLALRAARMRAEWREHPEATFGTCLRMFLFHNAAVAWLPLRSGEGVYLWWLTRRWQVPLGAAIASLLWLRLQDALVLAWLSLAWFMPGRGAVTALPALAVGALALAFGPRLWRSALAQLDTPALRDAPGRLARIARQIGQACRASRGGRTGWLMCGANWCLKIGVVALLLEALSPMAAGDAARAALAGEWAAILPLNGPAGLGPYEAGVWLGAIAQTAAPQPPALADIVGAALLAHLYWLLISGTSAAVAWALSRRPSNPLPESAA